MIAELALFRNITYDYKNDDDVFVGRGLHLNTLTDKINEIIGIVNDETDGSILVDTITELTPGAGVTIGPNVVITGTLTVGGDTTINAPLIVDDDASVVGRTTTGLLTVTGSATFNATVALMSDKRIVFDADGDSFSFITTDFLDVFGYGVNTLMVSSLSGKIVMYDGDNLALSAVEMLSIELGTGAIVDNIEVTLTNDDTHIPTSGAVYKSMSGSIHAIRINIPTGVQDGDTFYTTIPVGSTIFEVRVNVIEIFDDTTPISFELGNIDDPDRYTGVGNNFDINAIAAGWITIVLADFINLPDTITTEIFDVNDIGIEMHLTDESQTTGEVDVYVYYILP